MNRKTLSAIQALTDDTGRFIWQQSLSDPLKQTIFGVPVVVSSHMPDVAGDALSIAIGDYEQLGSKLPSFKRVLTERYVSQSHPFA